MSAIALLKSFLSPRSLRRQRLGIADNREHYPTEVEERFFPVKDKVPQPAMVTVPAPREPLSAPQDEVYEPGINENI